MVYSIESWTKQYMVKIHSNSTFNIAILDRYLQNRIVCSNRGFKELSDIEGPQYMPKLMT